MLHPITKWAQRKDKVFIEIGLMDILNEKIQLTATHLSFKGESAQKAYEFNLELFADVLTEDSKWYKTGFHMLFILAKKDTNTGFWPRLIKPKEKNQYIQIDWFKWVDQEEQSQDANKGLGGLDPSQMQNFDMGGQMGGMGGDMDDEDQGDLDDLDKEEDLEKPEKDADANQENHEGSHKKQEPQKNQEKVTTELQAPVQEEAPKQ